MGQEAQGNARGQADNGEGVEELLAAEISDDLADEQQEREILATRRDITSAVKALIVSDAHDPVTLKTIVKLMQKMGVRNKLEASQLINQAFSGMSKLTLRSLPKDKALAAWLSDAVRYSHAR